MKFPGQCLGEGRLAGGFSAEEYDSARERLFCRGNQPTEMAASVSPNLRGRNRKCGSRLVHQHMLGAHESRPLGTPSFRREGQVGCARQETQHSLGPGLAGFRQIIRRDNEERVVRRIALQPGASLLGRYRLIRTIADHHEQSFDLERRSLEEIEMTEVGRIEFADDDADRTSQTRHWLMSREAAYPAWRSDSQESPDLLVARAQRPLERL